MFFNLRLLERIRTEPLPLTGDQSVLCLRSFLDGYAHNRSLRAPEAIWFPINDHLRAKYGISQSAHGYPELLLLVSSGDTAAFTLFFSELDEYLTAHGTAASDPSSWRYPLPQDVEGVERLFPLMETLRAMEARPAMYLGAPSVTRLHAFLAGELTALQDDGRDIGEMGLLHPFESWLNARERFPFRYRWDRILLFRNGGRDDDAFDEFLELFRSYMEDVLPQ
ncbi:hypothetical protein [uncultured Paludibaculum sp.]|uniref:hypothetical protein n=1 Tax=uncultured Paludibaculum sp. TaxID=1765020 RepID=UPI002AAACD6F|nr:hypothetical protein [uncultured Paludibaculum sp.]